MTNIHVNLYGFTRFESSDEAGRRLTHALEASGISYSTYDLASFEGPSGTPSLIGYTSPKLGMDVTVLCIPRSIGDSFSEDYFYFERHAIADLRALTEADWRERFAFIRDVREALHRDLLDSIPRRNPQ